ncbi:MAG: tetratricopeptide repeat protein [Deltaproteobacteria bacterium]|nr:tetratricopeptide repeat protein [Deltaproteobacteria bacterium]
MKTKRNDLSTFLGIFLTIALPLSLTLSCSAGLNPEEEFEKALALYKKKEYAQALKTFQTLEEEYKVTPFQPDLLFMQGQALRALQRWPEAVDFFSKAAAVHPMVADYALYYQGEALQMAGERMKSWEVFKSLVERHPKSLLLPQAKLKMAEIHFQLEDYQRSAEVCENLLRESPKKDYPAEALSLLGQAKENLGRWPEAIRTYQELWLKYPLHPLAEKAKDRWDSLIKEKKVSGEKIPPEALLRRSLQFYQAYLHEMALGEMERIEGFLPQAYPDGYAGERWIDELYFHRGMCLFRLKKYSQAAENFHLLVGHSRNDEMAEKSLFWMTRALFRLGRSEEALNSFALLQSAYPRGAFLDQALYLKARILEEKGDYAPAISLYREIVEKFPQSSLRFQAMWQTGWLLLLGKDALGALQVWDRLQGLDPNSPWTEKVLYWKGRTLEEMGRTREAQENYQQLCKNYPASYYSLLAITRKRPATAEKRIPVSLQDHPISSFFKLPAQPAGSGNWHLERGRLLARLGLLSVARDELEAAEEDGKSSEEMRLEISRLYREVGEYHRSALLIRRNIRLRPLAARLLENEKILYLLAYPLGNSAWINHYAKSNNLDPALLSAVILEESRFNPQAVSPAGARGLMQVLPSTATQIVQRMRVRPYSNGLLFDPEINLRLGSWYLSSLMEEFGGKETLALAGYNAGPHMVRHWMAKTPAAREDEFVESIPYAETRNYVIRVITSAQVYRMLYGVHQKSGQPLRDPLR